MLNIWGLTDIGLVRKENQDTYGVRFNSESGHTICVVCDGMGGAKGGALASLLASETFLSSCMGNLREEMNRDSVEKVAEFAIDSANSAVYERAETVRCLSTMWATAAPISSANREKKPSAASQRIIPGLKSWWIWVILRQRRPGTIPGEI